MKDKTEVWQHDIKVIHNILMRILSDKKIFEEYIKISESNPLIMDPKYFHLWLCRGFFVNSLITIRKLIDRDKNTISLWNLLVDIRKNNMFLCRKWYSKTFIYDWSDTDFNKISCGSDILPKRIISEDLKKLKLLSEKIEIYVNDFLAHTSKNPKDTSYIPKYNEIDLFYLEVENISKKYILLLTGSGMDTLLPVIQEDWMKIFKFNWLNK